MSIRILLEQNYPNPFNATTNIRYRINRAGFVSLIIYNALGQEIEKPVNQYQASGAYSVKFNAGNLPSGVYFYKLRCGSFAKVNKMLLLR